MGNIGKTSLRLDFEVRRKEPDGAVEEELIATAHFVLVAVRRDTLLRLIRIRFNEPPAEVIATIQACADASQLDAWIDGVVTARRLAEVGPQTAETNGSRPHLLGLVAKTVGGLEVGPDDR